MITATRLSTDTSATATLMLIWQSYSTCLCVCDLGGRNPHLGAVPPSHACVSATDDYARGATPPHMLACLTWKPSQYSLVLAVCWPPVLLRSTHINHNHRAWSLPCVRQAARMMVKICGSLAAAVSIGAMVAKTNALLARLRRHEAMTWII